MLNNIRERYKVSKTPTEQSYEQQLGLKNNKEYETRVNNTMLQIVNIFINRYKGVSIEPPREEKNLKKV